MGTEYNISWISAQSAYENDVVSIKRGVDEILRTINKSMSTYDPDSELSLINTNYSNDWQEISKHFYRVLTMSQSIYERSNTSFDITIGPLVNLWGFGPSEGLDVIPSKKAIQEQLSAVGAAAISLRQNDIKGVGNKFEIKLAAKRYIDLSAIAKGYAVDVVGEYLANQGINNFLVEVGGEILARGKKAGKQPWRIAIEAPKDNVRTAQIVIPLSDMGIATSGDYRNFFKQDGHRFSHTIDNRTGYPVDHNLASVTVIHESVAMADAWATALTVLGADEGLKVAEQQGLLAFFIQRVDNGYKQTMSSHFKQLDLASNF